MKTQKYEHEVTIKYDAGSVTLKANGLSPLQFTAAATKVMLALNNVQAEPEPTHAAPQTLLEPLAIKTKEAAKMLGVSETTLRSKAKKGIIKQVTPHTYQLESLKAYVRGAVA